ncbi:MAG: hypothetical protein ACI85K_000982 [Hyphomicrobiaceae bacterium]|jgi:hypothetical protein
MSVLFVLLPASTDSDSSGSGLGAEPAFPLASPSGVTMRSYPQASDAQHLVSLVRDGRDRGATRWLRGLVLAIAGGAILGATTNAILSIGFGMFSGLSSIAIPLGFAVGAFLGAFTAAMTGTHRVRDDLRPLLHEAQPGDTLLQWFAPERPVLQSMRTLYSKANIACVLLD